MPFNEAVEHKTNDDGTPKFSVEYNLDSTIGTQNLSLGALNLSANILSKFRIAQVLVHSSVALSDTTISVYFDSQNGANYDTMVGEAEFDGSQDIGLVSGDNMLGVVGLSGDDIVVKSSGSDSAGMLYVTIIYEKLT